MSSKDEFILGRAILGEAYKYFRPIQLITGTYNTWFNLLWSILILNITFMIVPPPVQGADFRFYWVGYMFFSKFIKIIIYHARNT